MKKLPHITIDQVFAALKVIQSEIKKNEEFLKGIVSTEKRETMEKLNIKLVAAEKYLKASI